jgi:glycosyltransferase involved in cell wall biosynthesis
MQQHGREHLNLLFVGRLDAQKGFDLLLSALGAVNRNDIILHVVGDAFLDKRSNRKLVPTNVVFHGWKPRHEVSLMYREADALVVPSRWEGFGLVAAEALRAGCPVVAAKVGGLPELVVEKQTGYLFRPDSVADLTRALQQLRREDLLGLRPQARSHYLAHFQASRMNQQLCTLYDSLSFDSVAPVAVAERT